jgi:L-lactate utilization protein LutB
LGSAGSEVPDLCVECGGCEEKCPCDLPIIETIKRTAELARGMMDAV